MSDLEAQLEPKKYIGLSLYEEYVSRLEKQVAELKAERGRNLPLTTARKRNKDQMFLVNYLSEEGE